MSTTQERSPYGRQTGLMDAYGNFNPGGVMDNAFNEFIAIGQVDGEANVVPGDPVLYNKETGWFGNDNNPTPLDYALTATRVGSETRLSWTYPGPVIGVPGPPNFEEGILVGEYASVGPIGLYLQRSSTGRAMPNESDVARLVTTVSGSAPSVSGTNPPLSAFVTDANDLDWVTIKQWYHSELKDIVAPTTYTDSSPETATTIFAYRLVYLARKQTAPWAAEVDWNVVVVIPTFTLTADPQADGTHLSWNVPRLFFDSTAVVRSAAGSTITNTAHSFIMPVKYTGLPPGQIPSNQLVTVPVQNGAGLSYDGVYLVGSAGYMQVKVTGSSSVGLVNPAFSVNAAPGSTVNTAQAITVPPWTNLTWTWGEPTLPASYTLYKSSDGINLQQVATLAGNFTQPFQDAEIPNPALWYKLVANFASAPSFDFKVVKITA